MPRYVKYTQACGCDADPLPSYTTDRVPLDAQGYQGIAVKMHPQVCPVCKTPYREQPVQHTVD